VAGLALAMILVSGSTLAMEGYYRSPTLRGDVVVFTAEGDLWTHNLSSGQTLRLTTHSALETNAALSPDGQQLAFVADYEGVREVYVMPISGGVPRRISHENDSVVVQGWSSSGKVIYAAANKLGAPRCQRDNITFKQTPYALDV
jgi:tricorn protease